MNPGIAYRPVLEALGDLQGRCLGAAFCTYTSDIRFFEEKVLATVLDLVADPREEAPRFLEEARARIREVPVVLVADGSMLRGGRRIPFDLLEIHERLFHPKLALVLLERSARALIGSGNITEGGFGANSELFLTLDLTYAKARDRAILRDIASFLQALGPAAKSPGTQLAEFQRQLDRLCPDEPARPSGEAVWFLHTASGESLLRQVLQKIPKAAKIRRVGLLAPFYEEDGSELEAGVLSALRAEAKSRGSETRFDIGLPWDDNPLAAPQGKIPSFESRLGELWCHRREERGEECLEYYVPQRVTDQRVYYRSPGGESLVWDLSEAAEARASRYTWPVGEVRTYGPKKLLSALASACGDVGFWLFPGARIERGHLVRRPLHAKILLLGVLESGRDFTYILVGSPNASRSALLLEPPSGNIEAAILLRLQGSYELPDLAPQVAWCPLGQIVLQERDHPAPATNHGLAVRKAVYYASAQRLEVEWDLNHLPGEPFRLVYAVAPERELFSGDRPIGPLLTIAPFTLDLTSAELMVCVGGARFAVQIEVGDLEALPSNPLVGQYGLEELLALLGNRIGGEKIGRLRARAAGGELVDADLKYLFGERFQPSDVFRAWFGLRRQIEEPALSVGGLRVLIDGPAGTRAVWTRMKEAAGAGKLAAEEVWFYGLELHRTLGGVAWPVDTSSSDKARLVTSLRTSLWDELTAMSSTQEQAPGLSDVIAFYGASR